MANGLRSRMTLNGDKNLAKLLKTLPNRAAKKALKAAVTAGATPIVKATRSRAKGIKVSGLMAKAVSKRVKSYPGGTAVALIGASRELQGEYRGRKRVPANYWHLVLGGTRPHAIGSGTHPGAKAQNILADAVQATSGQVGHLMEAKLKSVVESEAAKLA